MKSLLQFKAYLIYKKIIKFRKIKMHRKTPYLKKLNF